MVSWKIPKKNGWTGLPATSISGNLHLSVSLYSWNCTFSEKKRAPFIWPCPRNGIPEDSHFRREVIEIFGSSARAWKVRCRVKNLTTAPTATIGVWDSKLQISVINFKVGHWPSSTGGGSRSVGTSVPVCSVAQLWTKKVALKSDVKMAIHLVMTNSHGKIHHF